MELMNMVLTNADMGFGLLALQAAFRSSTWNQCTEFLAELNKLQKRLNSKLRKDYNHKPGKNENI